MSLIASVRVDRVNIGWGQKRPNLSVHFNCFDAGGASLPGLGGYITRWVVEKRKAWDKDADALCQAVAQMAQRWVANYDEYSDGATPVTLLVAELQLYLDAPDDRGAHFRFQRTGDFFEASLLLEYRAGVMHHNQKRTVTNAVTVNAALADIDEVFVKAQALAWSINQARQITTRGRRL